MINGFSRIAASSKEEKGTTGSSCAVRIRVGRLISAMNRLALDRA